MNFKFITCVFLLMLFFFYRLSNVSFVKRFDIRATFKEINVQCSLSFQGVQDAPKLSDININERNLSDALSISLLLTHLRIVTNIDVTCGEKKFCKSSAMTWTVTFSRRVCTQLVLYCSSLVFSSFIYSSKIFAIYRKIVVQKKDQWFL